VTPGKDGSERSAMTATRLGRVGTPEAAGLLLDQLVVARSRSPALGLRLGLAGLAVASAVVGLVLFDDADPALCTNGYWAVRELLPAAIAFSIGGAVLLGYRKARWPGWRLIGRWTAGRARFAIRRALVGHNVEARRIPRVFVHRKRHRDRSFLWAFADGAASALPRRTAAREALEGLARRLVRVVLATLKNEYNFPTISDLPSGTSGRP
jgi:hypothetical protein